MHTTKPAAAAASPAALPHLDLLPRALPHDGHHEQEVRLRLGIAQLNGQPAGALAVHTGRTKAGSTSSTGVSCIHSWWSDPWQYTYMEAVQA
jgi:hypothetical protein